jgi:Protein of unknown function (DUF3606)
MDVMADNKAKKDGRDRSKVNSKEAYEVEYLHSKYPNLSHQQVYSAIRAAGPVRKDIEQYLKGKGKI